MTKILITLFIVLSLATFAKAQDSFAGAGLNITRSSAPDPSPLKKGDGGYVFPGGYVEGGLKLPYGLQARLQAEYNTEATLPTIFTRDEGASREATGEFRIRPEVRYWFGEFGILRPFVAGGVDYYRQTFKTVGHEEEDEDEYEYGGGAPKSGLNPTFTVGTGIGKSHETSFTRLFEDRTNLNASYLSGYRAGYSYTRPLYDRISLNLGAEADYVRFQENAGYGPKTADKYYEKDAIFKVRIGLVIK